MMNLSEAEVWRAEPLHRSESQAQIVPFLSVAFGGPGNGGNVGLLLSHESVIIRLPEGSPDLMLMPSEAVLLRFGYTSS